MKKTRMMLDLARERRIFMLQKEEKVLYQRLQSSSQIPLNSIKEDLQMLTTHFHRIKAMAYMSNLLKYLDDKVIELEFALNGRKPATDQTINHVRTVAWGLYKVNSEQAPEFIRFFAPLIGDIRHADSFIDRELYFYLAWAVPQDLECFKYLEGFLVRNQVPANRIGHEGWISNDLKTQIKSLETQEINRSQMRAKTSSQTPVTPVTPVAAPFNTFGASKVAGVSGTQKNSSITDTPSFQAPPLPTCTQGELGLEQGVKYGDDFEKDLAFLKQDLGVMKNDPVQSAFYEEATRRQPLDPKAVEELDFEKAMAELKASKFIPGQPLGNNPEATPGATRGHPELASQKDMVSEILNHGNFQQPVNYVAPLQGTKIFSSELNAVNKQTENTSVQPAAQLLPSAFPTCPGHPSSPSAPGYNMPIGPTSPEIIPAIVPILPSQPPIYKQPPVQPLNHLQDQLTYVKFLRSVGI